MAAITGAIIGAASLGANILGQAGNKRRAGEAQAQAEARLQQTLNSRQAITNPYSDTTDNSSMINNPFANLTVNTKAAEFENEKTDQSLSNILDTMRQSGGGQGSATQLAKAAIESKANIAASIGAQESKNALARGEGEQFATQAKLAEKARVQEAQGRGKQFMFNAQEDRTNMDLNRYASLSDQYAQQKENANSAMWSSIGSVGGMLGQGLSSAYGS